MTAAIALGAALTRPFALVLLGLVTLLLAQPLRAQVPDGLTLEHITVAGQDRTYYLHVPTALVGRSGLAAVFVFHGGQGTGLDAANPSQMAAAADAAGFVAVFPNALGQWNDGRSTTAQGPDDVAFVQAMVAELARSHGVDAGRIFVSGISNGGMFTQRLACDATGSFRAFGVVAAYLPQDYAGDCHPSRPAAISFFNGSTDPIMPWDGGAISSTPGGVGQGGNVLSHADTMAFWSQGNECQTLAGPTAWPDAYRDGTTVQSEGLSDCAGGVTMEIYIIDGGGHTWPGSGAATSLILGRTSKEISATNQIVAFFQRYGL